MWGIENWGTMLWRGPVSVSGPGPIGLLGMALALMITGRFLLSNPKALRYTSLLSVLCFFLMATAAIAVPNTFVNGEVADATEVNANFSNLESRVTALEQGTTKNFEEYVVDIAQVISPGQLELAVRARPPATSILLLSGATSETNRRGLELGNGITVSLETSDFDSAVAEIDVGDVVSYVVSPSFEGSRPPQKAIIEDFNFSE